MIDDRAINEAAQDVKATLWSDSRVKAELEDIIIELMADAELRGRLPTSEEIFQLICGGDDGEVPLDLMDMFPNLDNFIAELYR